MVISGGIMIAMSKNDESIEEVNNNDHVIILLIIIYNYL